MSDFLDLMKSEGWDKHKELGKPTTFKSSESEKLSEEQFENITGLPFRMSKLTIFELVSRYGGPMQLDKWAGILSKLMTALEKDQKSRERKNELIEKDFVTSNVFLFLNIFMDAAFDLAESQTEVIISMVLSDSETAKFKIPELRKKSYTKISKEAKKSINDSLKRLENKYDIDND